MRSWLGLSNKVQKGVEVPVEEEELLQERISQVVVVVHSIGEKFAQRTAASHTSMSSSEARKGCGAGHCGAAAQPTALPIEAQWLH